MTYPRPVGTRFGVVDSVHDAKTAEVLEALAREANYARDIEGEDLATSAQTDPKLLAKCIDAWPDAEWPTRRHEKEND